MWLQQEYFTEIGKLLLAALLGGAIGFERESHGQSAGFRTNLLVCMGACLMMLLSLHMESLYRHLDENSVVRVDPGRIASYAIASMGFLGAGAIIKGKGSVRGLTTAASLWLVTGVGLSVGAGYLLPAVFTTLVSLVILYNLRVIKIGIPRDIYTILTLTFQGCDRPLGEIRNVLSEYPELDLRFVNYHCSMKDCTVTYRLRFISKDNIGWGKITGRLKMLPGLVELRWDESDVP